MRNAFFVIAFFVIAFFVIAFFVIAFFVIAFFVIAFFVIAFFVIAFFVIAFFVIAFFVIKCILCIALFFIAFFVIALFVIAFFVINTVKGRRRSRNLAKRLLFVLPWNLVPQYHEGTICLSWTTKVMFKLINRIDSSFFQIHLREHGKCSLFHEHGYSMWQTMVSTLHPHHWKKKMEWFWPKKMSHWRI